MAQGKAKAKTCGKPLQTGKDKSSPAKRGREQGDESLSPLLQHANRKANEYKKHMGKFELLVSHIRHDKSYVDLDKEANLGLLVKLQN